VEAVLTPLAEEPTSATNAAVLSLLEEQSTSASVDATLPAKEGGEEG